MTITKDIAKSVHQKLKNIAQKNNESVENILYRYATERLLYRLSQSKYKDQFLLLFRNSWWRIISFND